MQTEEYLLACYRYIELNPVRAGLVRHPGEHAWSSYRANAESFEDSRITPHQDYLRLGQSEGARKDAYRDLVASGLEDKQLEEIRAATNGNFALGDPAFRRRISSALGRRAERGVPGRPSRTNGNNAGQLGLLGR